MRAPTLSALTMTVAGTIFVAGGPSATAGAAAADNTAQGWVTGVAVDSAGKPVEDALVNVLQPLEVPETGLVPDRTDRRTWTAADGSFRVRQGRGAYLVQICHPDPDNPTVCRETSQGVDFVITYVGGSGTTDSWVLQQSLLTASAADRDLGTIAVQPQARLVGTLHGAREGEEVRLMRLNDTVAFRTWTNKAGNYALDGLVPGRYYVAAGETGELAWSSAPVELTADSTTRVDGALDRGAVISGRLRAAIGDVARALVVIKRPQHGIVAEAPTDRRGRFIVSGLVPGTYAVGVSEPGGIWQPRWTKVVISKDHQVVTPVVRVRRGAIVVADLRQDGRLVADATVELRNRRGTPVLTGVSDARGVIRFGGLRPGRYTVVAAGRSGFGTRTFNAAGKIRLPTLHLDRPFLSVRGRTTPHAVVEATSGDFCPPDGIHRFGAFHEISVANARGRYHIDGLVPGRYMLGADGWPRNYAPRCWSGVQIFEDLRRNLPLERGATVTGRLVYSESALPVVTSLSYELFHKPGRPTNPTEEHPARGRTVGRTGTFTIDRITPGSKVAGRLARESGDGINDERFFVTFPFQDGTPYWLDSAVIPMTVRGAGTQTLGDIPVSTHGR